MSTAPGELATNQEKSPLGPGETRANVADGRSPKDKRCLLAIFERCLKDFNVDRNDSVLALGAGEEDLSILSQAGFRNIEISNIDSTSVPLDAESIRLPDANYPIVFAHAVLHHCRSPQKALGEMIRVSQKAVFFVEPNDSWALRTLVRLRLSFPFEIAAVADNGYLTGGLRNGPIPNYIYRWTTRELEKAAHSYHPERQFRFVGYPYWDFYVNEHELLARKESRVAGIAKSVGASNFISMLRGGQKLLNAIPASRSQGNKFLGAVLKGNVWPWIELQNGSYILKRN